MSSLLTKVGALVLRTLAKPLGSRFEKYVMEHPRAREWAVAVAQVRKSAACRVEAKTRTSSQGVGGGSDTVEEALLRRVRVRVLAGAILSQGRGGGDGTAGRKCRGSERGWGEEGVRGAPQGQRGGGGVAQVSGARAEACEEVCRGWQQGLGRRGVG